MEQSSTPWRVFDAPTPAGPGDPAAQREAAPAAAPSAEGTNQRLALAGALGALAIGALAVVVAMSGAGGEIVEGPGSVPVAAGSSDPVAAAGGIVVDVAGAVVNPGVYRLAAGARVGDAITAAGGFGPRVDVDRVGVELNLAAQVVDGAQIRVPSRDDVASPGGGGSSEPGGAPGGPGGQLINLNSASQSELESLPGIGPVTAVKILESRAGARFTSVEELRERGLVGEKTFESLRALVAV